MWAVDWSNEDSDNSVTIFDTEENALKSAVSDIVDDVQGWDLDDPDSSERELALEINAAIAAGNYRQVLRKYNDYQSNRGYGEQYFHVSEYGINTFSRDPEEIDIPIIEDDDEDEDDDDDSGVDPNQPFVATSVGATCRGPCHNYFPDAYADKSDGTFECHQCKTFKNVFGSP